MAGVCVSGQRACFISVMFPRQTQRTTSSVVNVSVKGVNVWPFLRLSAGQSHVSTEASSACVSAQLQMVASIVGGHRRCSRCNNGYG